MSGVNQAIVTIDNDQRDPSKEYDWNIKGLGETLRKIKNFDYFSRNNTVMWIKTCMVTLSL